MKIGFIGCGNMASAMLEGILRKNSFPRKDLMASALSEKTLQKIREKFQIEAFTDNRALAEAADVIILAVKPIFFEKVLEEIRDVMNEKKILVSLAPGKTLSWFENQFDFPVKVVRTMPNTPALVGEGISAVCPNGQIQKEELEIVVKIFESFGLAECVEERMIDAVIGVSGSSPAYVFMFIEAMADAAVAEGMPRAMAYQFAAQAVLGSAKMVLETEKHPGELKDMVCSPGGTTIQAVRILEEKGFRSAVMEAIHACVEKSRQM